MKKTKLLIAAFLTFNFGLLTLKSFAQYTNLHNFANAGGEGLDPQGSLISDGTFLYGTTYQGGTSTYGTIFKVKTDGTGYIKLFDFNGTNGRAPKGSLVSDGTFLYGTTAAGGTHSVGVIFKIMPDGTGYTDLHDFAQSTVDGSGPYGSLLYDGTFLYGTTYQGGAINTGSIFKIKPDGTGFTILHSFSSTEGWNPEGDLISDGTFLYGMTSSNACTTCMGNIFKIMPDGSGYTDLHDFSGGANGIAGVASLISDGTFLYGMTSGGGTSTACSSGGCGLLFKIKPDGTGYSDLHDFTAAPDGKVPKGSLISFGTFLYGMTTVGGSAVGSLCPDGCGTIFKIKPDGSGYTKVFDFDFTNNGSDPYASLFSDGTNFYGTTDGGGTGFYGTVFKINPTTLGIEENNMQTDFTISPNPSNGIFNLKINGSENLKMKNIEIYNVVGEKVYQSQLNNPQSEIDLRSQPAGIYFLHLQTEQGTLSKKLIIN